MSTGDAVTPEGTTVHPSDSAAQRDAEPLMIDAVAAAIGVPLSKRKIDLGDGVWCEVDGVSNDGLVLVEAFAHHGRMVGGQLRKVSEDAFKLVTLAKTRTCARLILVFADDVAARSFLGRSWKAEALRLWNVEVLVVELDDTARDGVRAAQVRQYR